MIPECDPEVSPEHYLVWSKIQMKEKQRLIIVCCLLPLLNLGFYPGLEREVNFHVKHIWGLGALPGALGAAALSLLCVPLMVTNTVPPHGDKANTTPSHTACTDLAGFKVLEPCLHLNPFCSQNVSS